MMIKEIGTNNQFRVDNIAVQQFSNPATNSAEKKDSIDSAKASGSWGQTILNVILSPWYFTVFVFKGIVSFFTCGYFSEKTEDYEGIQKYLTNRVLPIFKKGSPAERIKANDKLEMTYPGHIGNKGAEIYVESKRKEELEAAKKKEGDKFKEAEWISQWNKDNAKAVKEKFIEGFEKYDDKIVKEYIAILAEKNKPVEKTNK